MSVLSKVTLTDGAADRDDCVSLAAVHDASLLSLLTFQASGGGFRAALGGPVTDLVADSVVSMNGVPKSANGLLLLVVWSSNVQTLSMGSLVPVAAVGSSGLTFSLDPFWYLSRVDLVDCEIGFGDSRLDRSSGLFKGDDC